MVNVSADIVEDEDADSDEEEKILTKLQVMQSAEQLFHEAKSIGLHRVRKLDRDKVFTQVSTSIKIL